MHNRLNRSLFALALVFSFAQFTHAKVARVACVGDSITYGAGVKDRTRNCYPVQLELLLGGEDYEVRNFGVNGATMLKKGDKPYWKQKAFKAATEFKPHIVVIKLGTNDTKPKNWKHKGEFAADVTAMVDHFASLDTKPKIWLCKPVPAFPDRWGINDKCIREEVIPIVAKVAKEKNLPVIDLYTAFEGKAQFFPDKIHPNAAGAKMIAQIISKHLAPSTATTAGLPDGYKLVYSQNFIDTKSKDAFHFTDDNAWKLGATSGGEGDRHYMELFGRSNYKYKVRSPLNIALVSSHEFGSFVMDLDMMQTGREYGHRDMCLFYNFQNRSQFYYTHISSTSDAHAHQIFIVNNKPRTKISKTTTKGHKWSSKKWHQVRLVRDIDSGRIEIYVNDMNRPIMTAEDKTFGWGRVGVGSFDDTGRVSNVRIYAKEAREAPAKKHLFTD